jgi:hypothetical protein
VFKFRIALIAPIGLILLGLVIHEWMPGPEDWIPLTIGGVILILVIFAKFLELRMRR